MTNSWSLMTNFPGTSQPAGLDGEPMRSDHSILCGVPVALVSGAWEPPQGTGLSNCRVHTDALESCSAGVGGRETASSRQHPPTALNCTCLPASSAPLDPVLAEAGDPKALEGGHRHPPTCPSPSQRPGRASWGFRGFCLLRAASLGSLSRPRRPH